MIERTEETKVLLEEWSPICDIQAFVEDNGETVYLPLESVAHAPEGIRLDENALSIIWFEEGDGAALYENERMLAVIPGWSGQDFSGYSIHARGMGPFAWELESALPVLEERLKRCRTYWAIMESDYFGEMQQAQLVAMEAFFGPRRQYFAIDKDSFPPRALVTW